MLAAAMPREVFMFLRQPAEYHNLARTVLCYVLFIYIYIYMIGSSTIGAGCPNGTYLNLPRSRNYTCSSSYDHIIRPFFKRDLKGR